MNDIASIIERRRRDFPAFTERFSEAPRTVSVSGKPKAPPKEKPIYSRATGRRLTAPSQGIGAIPKRGRKSDIDIAVCPGADTPGGPHAWHGKGQFEVRCAKCPRIALRSLIGDAPIHQTRYKQGPVVLANPNQKPCKTGKEHHWQRDGRVDGKPRARCRWCRTTAERMP